MREYKFRAKPKQTGGIKSELAWAYGDLVQKNGKSYIAPSHNAVKVENNLARLMVLIEVDPETVGQVFPFKDGTENELYPGDIIKTVHKRDSENSTNDDPFSNTALGYEEYEKIGLLEYYQGYNFGPRLRWKKGHMMIPNTSTLWRMKAVKLGNRWDNPELLGG